MLDTVLGLAACTVQMLDTFMPLTDEAFVRVVTFTLCVGHIC